MSVERSESKSVWRAPVVAVLTCALSVTALTWAPTATASPPVAPAAAVTPPPVTGLLSEVAAMRAAQAQGSRVEVLGEHTASQRVWANPDGSLTMDAYPGPQFVQDDTGAWRDIDTRLQVSGDGSSVVPIAAAGQVVLANGAADPAGSAPATAVTVTAPGSSADLADGAASVKAAAGAAGAPVDASPSGSTVSVSVGWDGALPKPTLTANTATYANVAPGEDLRVTVKPRGVEAFVDLDKPTVIPASGITVSLPLSAKGLTATGDGHGGYVLKDAAGAVVSDAPPARVWDASVDPASGDPGHSVVVPTSVTPTGSGWDLTATVPASFLSDPSLTWPVTVDPTATIYASADTYIEQGYNTSNFGTEDALKVGTYDSGTHIARSLIYFPTNTLAGTHVASAYLHLYEFWSASCTARPIYVKRLTSGFSESTTTWNSILSVDATTYGTINDALGHDSGCPADYLGGSTGINISSLVDGWVTGPYSTGFANYGLELTASESDSLGWKQFYSSEHPTAAQRPHLTVTYDHYPAVPTGLKVSGVVNGWTRTLTPTLSATVTDPDGGNVTAQFAVYSGSTKVWPTSASYQSGSTVTSGATSSIVVPSGVLSTNTAYTVHARATDGSVPSAETVSGTFKIDTSTVATPTLSCGSGLPFNTYTNPLPTTAATCSATTSTGPSGVKTFTASLDGTALTGSLSGSTLSFTIPTAKLTTGWHNLTSVATNTAGATSASGKASFGLAPAAISATLAAPVDGQETAGSTPIQVSASTGVSTRLQYYDALTLTWTDIPVVSLKTSTGAAVTGQQPVPLSGPPTQPGSTGDCRVSGVA